MKFCKKCHKRVVKKIESNVDLSNDSVKVCMCGNQTLLLHGTVIKRLNSEMGVHEIKKLLYKKSKMSKKNRKILKP